MMLTSPWGERLLKNSGNFNFQRLIHATLDSKSFIFLDKYP